MIIELTGICAITPCVIWNEADTSITGAKYRKLKDSSLAQRIMLIM